MVEWNPFSHECVDIALSESLLLDLRSVDANVGVSVVLPEHVRSRLGSAERNRASGDGEAAGTTAWTPRWNSDEDPFQIMGEDPRVLGRRVVDAVCNEQFWIMPARDDPLAEQAIVRMSAIASAFRD